MKGGIKLSIRIRKAKEEDLSNIMEIEYGMYGEKDTFETFRKCFYVFPEGSLVAEDSDKVGEDMAPLIIGFVVTELIDEIMAIPYIHDPTHYHKDNGKVMYLSGFGVRKKYQEKNIGIKLYEELILFGKRKNIELFELLCNEEDPEDTYEMSILKELNFIKNGCFDWEVSSSKIKPHTAWIKVLKDSSYVVR